jgi:Tfp pilus assembly protein PilX
MKLAIIRRKRVTARQNMREHGVALILTLLSILILSLLATGMISSTQSEMWSTSSYRKTAQARYIAEAGAQQTVNWLTNTLATSSAINLLSNTTDFNLAASPVQYIGGSGGCSASSPCPVRMTSTKSNMLGGITDTISTFDSTSQGFESGFSTTLGTTAQKTAGIFSSIDSSGNSSFTAAAQLIEAHNTGNGWTTKWKITSQGTVGVVQPATVQVVEIVENLKLTAGSNPTPISSIQYGAFATSATCGAITINGGSSVASYNSSTQAGVANPSWSYSGGSIATLGNISLTGSGYVYGNVYAPGYNLGNSAATVYYPYGVSGGGASPYNNGSQACSSSKMYAVNEDNSGSAIQCVTNTSNCTNKASQMPSTYTATTYPSADMMVGNTVVSVPANAASCSFNVICSGGSGYYSSQLGQYVSSETLTPSTTSSVVNYGVVSLGGATTTTLNAGSYFMDTLNVGGSASVNISSSPVIIYVLDASGSSTPINITGGSFSNAGGTPANLTFIYNGTQEVHIGSISSNTLFASIYAPNASIVFDGNGSIYGAVIGKTVSVTGGGHIIYDTSLASTTTNIYIPQGGSTVSPLHLTNFSWSIF